MLTFLVPFLGVLSVAFAGPIELEGRAALASVACQVVNVVIGAMHKDAAVTPLYSSFLKNPTITTTTTRTITPSVVTSTMTTTSTDYIPSLVTITAMSTNYVPAFVTVTATQYCPNGAAIVAKRFTAVYAASPMLIWRGVTRILSPSNGSIEKRTGLL
jgi:hypothetical protein